MSDVSKEIQDEAQSKLDKAVQEYINTMGWDDGMLTTAWVLVAHQAGFDSFGDSISAYPMIYMNGTVPDPIAIGLLEISKRRLLEGFSRD